MNLYERFSKEFSSLKSSSIIPLLKTISVCDLSEPLPNQLDPKRTIFLGSKNQISESIPLFQKHGAEHFVQIDRDGFIYDLLAASIMLQKPEAFIKNPLPFFINHFKPNEEGDNVRSTTLEFNSSFEKSALLLQISQFLEANPKASNFIESIHMIADEMIMNAMYNAPVDPAGAPIFMNMDRAEAVELPGDKKAKIFITHDERRLLIGCEDPFGSVSRYKIMQQFAKVYRGDQASPNTGGGGAGLGCKMMIDHSCSFYMVVQKSKRTLVCCSLPLGVSYMKAERMSKNLHLVFF